MMTIEPNGVPSSENIGSLNKVILIIPAYEPNEQLIALIDNLAAKTNASIVVIDDGSGAAFAEIFDAVRSTESVTLLTHEVNRGKGAALKTAIRHVLEDDANRQHDYLITLDSDGQHCVEDILQLVSRCSVGQGELFLGVRDFPKSIPLRSRFGNLLTRKVLRWASKLDLQDTQTGLRGISMSFARSILAIEADRYEFELECLLVSGKQHIPIVQIPIRTIYIDDNSSSHFRPFTDSIKIYFVFARYIVVSLTSFVIDILFFTLLHFAGASIVTSTFLARLISGSFNFHFNKNLVFKSQNRLIMTREAIAYIVLAVVIASMSGVVVDHLVGLTHWNAPITKICVDSGLFILSFFAQKLIVFGRRTPDSPTHPG